MRKGVKSFSFIFVSVLLCGTMLFSAAGCGKQKLPDNEDTLRISAFLGGYGTQFLTDIGKKFEELNPGKKVYVYDNIALTNATLEGELKLGAKYNPTDLYFAGDVKFNQIVDKGANYLDGYDCVLEDLSDVYDSNPYGETVKISDKIQDGFKEYFTSKDQKQYVMNWAGGPNGLVYRNDYFIKNNWSVPNTTDELVSLTNTIRDNGYVPYIWNKSGYWDYVDYTWWAQYQGFDGYKDFFNAKNDSGKYTYEKFKQQGRLESMKVLSSLIANEKNSYPGSIASDHSSAQMKLYDQEDNYKVVMSPNGDWLENEMKKDYPAGTVDIRMMKTPVISSIVKVLPDKSITTDAQLSQSIAFIDGVDGAQKPAGLTDNDLSRIREARSLTYTLGYDHTAMIPVYANAKSLAKDYLRLMFSDIGLKIHHDTTGSTLPYKSDVYTSADTVSKMSSFQKSKNDILENSIYISRMYHNDPLFFKGGLRAYNKTVNGEYVVGALGAGKKSAETYILDEYNYIKSNFQTFKTNAGIKE